MPSTFDDLLTEAEDAGVDPDLIERFRAASEASPLRKENRELKAQLQTATESASKAQNVALGSTFEKLGIKAKPSAFNLPDDLDRTDFEAVQAWAVDQGLAEPPKSEVAGEHLDAEDRLAAASAGAGVPPEALDRALSADNEDDFYRELGNAGAVS